MQRFYVKFLCLVVFQTEKKKGDERRKAQNHQIIQARPGGEIGAQTVEEPSQSQPNQEVRDRDLLLGGRRNRDQKKKDRRECLGLVDGGRHQDREREDRRESRDLPEGGLHLNQEKEGRRECPGLREGEGLLLMRDLFLQPCPCLHQRSPEEDVRFRGILIFEAS